MNGRELNAFEAMLDTIGDLTDNGEHVGCYYLHERYRKPFQDFMQIKTGQIITVRIHAVRSPGQL